jgi:hypothetical protein
LPRQWRKWLKLWRVHLPRIQTTAAAAASTARVRQVINSAAGVNNGTKVKKLRASRRRVPSLPATGAGCFTGEQADTAVGSEGFLVGRVNFSPPATVNKSRNSNDNNGADDSGNGDTEELPRGRLGLGRLREYKGRDISRERSISGRRRRRWR